MARREKPELPSSFPELLARQSGLPAGCVSRVELTAASGKTPFKNTLIELRNLIVFEMWPDQHVFTMRVVDTHGGRMLTFTSQQHGYCHDRTLTLQIDKKQASLRQAADQVVRWISTPDLLINERDSWRPHHEITEESEAHLSELLSGAFCRMLQRAKRA